jgi:ribosomal protein S18 acetylase RimI-like enzyme
MSGASMTKINYRIFAEADYSAARKLWESIEGIGLSEADSPEAIARYLQRNSGLSFVAVAGVQLVGTILCGHDGRRGFIHHLAVRPDRQRQGIGSELLRRALRALAAEKIEKCHLFVFRKNASGCEFWRRIGGEERVDLAMFSLSPDR